MLINARAFFFDELTTELLRDLKPAARGSPVGLVVTLGSIRPERFSVDFRMLSTIFPLNNLLFNLLISVLHSALCWMLQLRWSALY